MKKTVVYCDLCGKECTKYKNLMLPRFVIYPVRGGIGNPILTQYKSIEEKETQICYDCLENLAMFLSPIYAEKEKDYK